MTTFFLVAACFIVGIFMQRYDTLRHKLTVILNGFAIYIAIPAIILAKVPELEFSPDTMFTVVSAWLVMGLSLLIVAPIGRRVGWSIEVIAAVTILAGLGNTAFLGMALSKLLLDDASLAYAIIYDQFGSFIILSLACPVALVIKEGKEKKVSAISIAKKVILFPPFVSLLIALLVPISALTEMLQTPIIWLTWSLLPVAMLIVGLQFQLRIEPSYRRPIALALIIKMLFAPVMIAAIGAVLGIPQVIFEASVIQSAMPPMVTPAVFLIGLNLAPRLTASILGLGTILAFVTIPAIAFFLH